MAAVGETELSIFSDYEYRRSIYLAVAVFITLLVLAGVTFGIRRQSALTRALDSSVKHSHERDLLPLNAPGFR